jgi:hypothetical protein
VSFTVTVNEHVASGPEPFDAVQLTVVVPTVKVEPLAGVQVTVGAGQPVEVVLKVTTAEHCPLSAFTVMLSGQVIAGASGRLVLVASPGAAVSGSSVNMFIPPSPSTAP